MVGSDDTYGEKKQIFSANYKKLVYTALQNDRERFAMMIQVPCHMDLRFCELKRLTVEEELSSIWHVKNVVLDAYPYYGIGEVGTIFISHFPHSQSKF